MRKSMILCAVAGLFLWTACHEPAYVAPTAQRQGITSLVAYFGEGPFEGKELGRLEIDDPDQDYFVIPVPWYYPEDSDNATTKYMFTARVQATLQPNCKIEPHLAMMDLTAENKFTYTDATGTSRPIVITGKRVKSSVCRIVCFDTVSPEVYGVVDEQNHRVYLPTTEDLSAATATYVISARTSITPDPSQPQNYNEGVVFTVISEDGDTRQEYEVVRRIPDKTDYGFTAATVERMFNVDPTTLGLPAFGEAVNVSMGVTGNYLVVNLGTGEAPRYFNKITGAAAGSLPLGSAVPTGSIASDEQNHLLLCNLAAKDETFSIWMTSSVSSAPELLVSFTNVEDVPMGGQMKVIGNVKDEAVITVVHDGIPEVTTSGRVHVIHLSGGTVVSNEVIDLFAQSGFCWGSGPSHATCVVAGSPALDGGYYSCAYSDNVLFWFKPDLTTGASLTGIGPDNELMYLNGNVDPNNLDTKQFNNARYLVLFASNHFPKWWPGPQLYVYDITGGALSGNVWDAPQLVYAEANNSMYDLQGQKGSHEGNGACGDVILAPSADGYKLYLYYYDHFCQMVGGLSMDCLKR